MSFFIKKILTWFWQNATSTTVTCDHYGVARSLRLDFQPFWEPTFLVPYLLVGRGIITGLPEWLKIEPTSLQCTSHLACRNLKSSVQLDSTSKVNLKGMDWKTYFPSYFSFWFFCNHCKVAPGNYNNPLMSLQASCTWLPVLAHTYMYIGNRKYNSSLKVSQSPHTCTWLILVYIIDKNQQK